MDANNVTLPLEMWGNVFKFCSLPQLLNSTLVCKEWNELIKTTAAIWESLLAARNSQAQWPLLNSWHEHYKVFHRREHGLGTKRHYCFYYANDIPHAETLSQIFQLTTGDIHRLWGFRVRNPEPGLPFLQRLNHMGLVNGTSYQIVPQTHHPRVIRQVLHYPHVAFARQDGIETEIRTVNIETKERRTLKFASEYFSCFAIEGSELIAAGVTVSKNGDHHNDLYQWSLESGTPNPPLKILGCESFNAIKVGADFILASSDQIYVINRKTNSFEILTTPEEFPLRSSFELSRNLISIYGQKFAALSTQGVLKIWSYQNSLPVLTCTINTGSKNDTFNNSAIVLVDNLVVLAWEKSSSKSSTGTVDVGHTKSQLDVWCTNTSKLLYSIPLNHPVQSLEANESAILAANDNQCTLLDFSLNAVSLSPKYTHLLEEEEISKPFSKVKIG